MFAVGCSIASLHHCTIATPLCTLGPSHHGTISPLHHCTIAPLCQCIITHLHKLPRPGGMHGAIEQPNYSFEKYTKQVIVVDGIHAAMAIVDRPQFFINEKD